MNAITSPNVMIRETVMASCAIPGIFHPVTLAAKDRNGKRVPYVASRQWTDGSVTNDLPTRQLARVGRISCVFGTTDIYASDK